MFTIFVVVNRTWPLKFTENLTPRFIVVCVLMTIGWEKVYPHKSVQTSICTASKFGKNSTRPQGLHTKMIIGLDFLFVSHDSKQERTCDTVFIWTSTSRRFKSHFMGKYMPYWIIIRAQTQSKILNICFSCFLIVRYYTEGNIFHLKTQDCPSDLSSGEFTVPLLNSTGLGSVVLMLGCKIQALMFMNKTDCWP